MRWSTKKIEGCCSVVGCAKKLKAKGLCDTHYQMNRKHGRTHRILQLYDGQLCSEEGCKSPARVCGYCRAHYIVARRSGALHPGKYKRDHPLYSLWWVRRQHKILAAEWHDDFQRFLADVGERPGQYFTLVTLRDGPFGPDNFRWREQIKRKKGETKRSFYARKWQAQVQARPAWNRQRDLARKYKISPEQYQQMLTEQNGVCAICRGPETRFDSRLGILTRLAVDHCHATGKVRGLLCSRCNVTIGRINESIDLLRAMEVYMQHHLTKEKIS